jgi:hypothetical protein
MMRKLSVASFASNFTKRSSSIASLHKATEDDSSTGIDAQKTAPARGEHSSSDVTTLQEAEDMSKSRLSVIQDEKENVQNDSVESLPSIMFGSEDSRAGTLRRFATTKTKSSWTPDGQRIITPPLRTSSANSLNRSRTTLLSTVSDVPIEAKENVPTVQPTWKAQKHGKRGKGAGKNRAVAEGILSIFR